MALKKLVLTALVFSLSCAFASEVVYTKEVKSLYLDKETSKVWGRLLPTNGVEVISKIGDVLKLKITGYQNPSAKNIIYFTNSKRIITAAFFKDSAIKTTIIEAGKNGAWDRVSLEVFAKDGGFVKELSSMMKEASELYVNSCGVCHSLHPVGQFSANQWPSNFKSMVDRTSIDKKDRWLVIQYLQKNASDMKK